MEIVIILILLIFSIDAIRESREEEHHRNNPSDILSVPPHLYQKYRDYLQSERWRELRFFTLLRDEHTCIRCRSTTNLQVHHTNYNGIQDMTFTINQLETVCKECHHMIHQDLLPMSK